MIFYQNIKICNHKTLWNDSLKQAPEEGRWKKWWSGSLTSVLFCECGEPNETWEACDAALLEHYRCSLNTLCKERVDCCKTSAKSRVLLLKTIFNNELSSCKMISQFTHGQTLNNSKDLNELSIETHKNIIVPKLFGMKP